MINAEGIIRPDHYKPINHDYDVEQTTLFMKQMDEVDGKLFVDIYDENHDSLPILKEINMPRFGKLIFVFMTLFALRFFYIW